MKTTLPQAIETIEEAKAFLKSLHDNGESKLITIQFRPNFTDVQRIWDLIYADEYDLVKSVHRTWSWKYFCGVPTIQIRAKVKRNYRLIIFSDNQVGMIKPILTNQEIVQWTPHYMIMLPS